MQHSRKKGADAEDLAAEYLLSRGYTIVTRRYCTRHGELDIIALDGETLVFVEVKHRMAEGYVPEESLGQDKRKHLASAASHYLKESASTRAYRYDVIAMDAKGMRHYENAFE